MKERFAGFLLPPLDWMFCLRICLDEIRITVNLGHFNCRRSLQGSFSATVLMATLIATCMWGLYERAVYMGVWALSAQRFCVTDFILWTLFVWVSFWCKPQPGFPKWLKSLIQLADVLVHASACWWRPVGWDCLERLLCWSPPAPLAGKRDWNRAEPQQQKCAGN